MSMTISGSGLLSVEDLYADSNHEKIQVIIRTVSDNDYYALFHPQPMRSDGGTPLQCSESSKRLYKKLQTLNFAELHRTYSEYLENYITRSHKMKAHQLSMEERKASKIEELKQRLAGQFTPSKNELEDIFTQLKEELKTIASKQHRKPGGITSKEKCRQATRIAIEAAIKASPAVDMESFPASWQQTIDFLNRACPELAIPTDRKSWDSKDGSNSTYRKYITTSPQIFKPVAKQKTSDIWTNLFKEFN